MSQGTVMVFGCSLRANKIPDQDTLEGFVREAIRVLGMGFRRFVSEDYKKPKGAQTLVAFLNESHFVLTTYPEDRIIELEMASCKLTPLTEFIHWVKTLNNFEVISLFMISKDDRGRWYKDL